MGIYNIVLLVLYFMHMIDGMSENKILFGMDIILVLGVTLAGFVLESIRYIRHRKSRPGAAGGGGITARAAAAFRLSYHLQNCSVNTAEHRTVCKLLRRQT